MPVVYIILSGIVMYNPREEIAKLNLEVRQMENTLAVLPLTFFSEVTAYLLREHGLVNARVYDDSFYNDTMRSAIDMKLSKHEFYSVCSSLIYPRNDDIVEYFISPDNDDYLYMTFPYLATSEYLKPRILETSIERKKLRRLTSIITRNHNEFCDQEILNAARLQEIATEIAVLETYMVIADD